MNKLYIAGIDEIPRRLTQQDNEELKFTFLCPPGYNGSIDFTIDILRPGVNLDIAGLYFCSHGENQRFNINVRHLAGGSTSRQLFKGIVGEGGSCEFDGLIHVAAGAGKTRALQENHTLLLSEKGVAETHPQLEIYADDVECSHGATIGRLDPDGQFYMRSRGIPEAEARRLQMLSFLSPVLERIPQDKRAIFIDGRF